MTADRRPGHDSGQKGRDARCRGHRDGPRDGVGEDAGGAAGHRAGAHGPVGRGMAGWVLVAMIRVATLVLCYLIVLVTTVRVIPVTGVFLYENSGVDADTPLRAQITFWLIPFCFLVLLMLVAEVSAFRALWALGSRCTARVRRTRHARPSGYVGPAQQTQPHGNTRPKSGRPRNGLSRNDARRAR